MAMSQPNSPGRWVRVALAVSLAANLLIVGLVAGATLTRDPERDRGPGLRDLGFGPFVAALPRSDRAALAARLRDDAGSLRARRNEMRRQFDALVAALQADPYDHARVAAIMASQQEEVFATQRLGRTILSEHIGAMSPSDRADFARSLARDVRHWKPGGPRRE